MIRIFLLAVSLVFLVAGCSGIRFEPLNKRPDVTRTETTAPKKAPEQKAAPGMGVTDDYDWGTVQSHQLQ